MQSEKWEGKPIRAKSGMVFGCLADTRAVLGVPQMAALKKAFKGVDAILHAGPLGDLRVLGQLEEIAPAAAVCANAEDAILRDSLYVKQVFRFGEARLGLIHGYGKPHGLKAWLLHQFEEDPVQAIVYGRDFLPCAREGKGVFFFNPGSFSGGLPEGKRGPGPSRVGLLYLRGRKWEGHSIVLA